MRGERKREQSAPPPFWQVDSEEVQADPVLTQFFHQSNQQVTGAHNLAASIKAPKVAQASCGQQVTAWKKGSA